MKLSEAIEQLSSVGASVRFDTQTFKDLVVFGVSFEILGEKFYLVHEIEDESVDFSYLVNFIRGSMSEALKEKAKAITKPATEEVNKS